MRFKVLVLFVFGLMFLCASPLIAQTNKQLQLAVFFKDKDTAFYQTQSSAKFFSERAIKRKQLQGVLVDGKDFPVTELYIKQLQKLGYYVHTTSKWLNCAVVYVPRKSLIDSLKLLPFVHHLEWIGMGKLPEPKSTSPQALINKKAQPAIGSVYGKAAVQTTICGADKLHKQGLNGEQTLVAVFDAGFSNANQQPVLQHALNNVLTTVDLLNKDNNVFDDDAHGTAVLSCMAAYDSFEYIGTSPQASYILIRTEDAKTEYPSEEFFWAIAAEFADSCGVDIIHSSLGYNEFDDVFFNHDKKQLNNHTAWISKAAEIATNKGMFVVSSAGNEGNNDWKLVAFPADVKSVLTVGSVNKKEQLSSFSSIGWDKKDDIKPNVVMLGEDVAIANDWGYVHEGDGTSYAAPILTGGIACLWPYFKTWSADSIIQFIQYTSTRFNEPTKYVGYGVPNFGLMYVALQKYDTDTLLDVFQNSIGVTQISLVSTQNQPIKIDLLDDKGGLIDSLEVEAQHGFQRFSLKLKSTKHKAVKQVRISTLTKTTLQQIP